MGIMFSGTRPRRTAQGWNVVNSSRTGSHPRLRLWKLPGIDRHFLLRDGAAGYVLMCWVLWFHRYVEKLDKGVWDEWAYSVRPVRGSNTVESEHGAGTAVDVNATLHPIGVKTSKTFTVKQSVKILKRMSLMRYAGVLVWGGSWSRPDAMHFELKYKPVKVLKSAKRLTNTGIGKEVLKANGLTAANVSIKPPR